MSAAKKSGGGFSQSLKGLVGWEDAEAAGNAQGGTRIRIDLIDPDPNQPRKEFDEAKLQELADSMREHNLQQPIGLRANPDAPGRYLIRFGERRWRAAKLLDWLEIDAIVSDAGNLPVQQLIENIQRDDLTPLEVAAALVATGLKHGALSTTLGKSKQWVTYHLALAAMAPEYQEAMRLGTINDVVTLYEANKLAEQFPDEVGALLSRASPDKPISRETVRSLGAQLRSPPAASTTSMPPQGKNKAQPPSPPPATASLPRVVVADAEGTEIGHLDLTKPSKSGKVVVVRGENLTTREPIEGLRLVRLDL